MGKLLVGSMAAGVWTGVGFSNLKNFLTQTRTGFQNFVTGAESESEKVTPATFGMFLMSVEPMLQPYFSKRGEGNFFARRVTFF